MRSLIFIPAIAISYVLLSGWPEPMSGWLRSGLAVAVICFALVLWRGSSDEKKGFFASLRKPNLLDYLLAGLAFLLFEFFFMTLFNFGPEYTRDLSYRVEEWVKTNKEDKTQKKETPGAPTELKHGNDGNWLWNSHYQRKIPKRANHKPKNSPEVFINVSSPDQAALMNREQIYVRAFTLNSFDGDSWFLANPIKRVLDAGTEGEIRLNSSPALKGFPIFHHTITHSHHPNGQNVLLGLQGALDVKLPYVTRIAPDIYLLPPKAADQDGYVYEVTSQPILFDQIISKGERIIPGTRSGGIDSIYFDSIPDQQLRYKMLNVLDTFKDDENLTATLISLRNMLRNRCQYSLKVENPKNLSPLENFLFGERKGYCEHFASAAASFCRELNIPSRIAFGWTGGKFYPESNQFMFVSADAHAWTEIYLKGYGWVVFDTTAPDENPTQVAGSDETPPPMNEPEYEEPAAEPIEAEVFSPWIMLAWTMGLGCSLLLVLIILKYRSTPTRTHSGGSGISYEEPDYLRLFRLSCAAVGCPYPDYRTLRKQMLTLEKRGILPDFSKVLLDYHNSVVYGNQERNSRMEKSIVRLIRQWQQNIKQAA